MKYIECSPAFTLNVCILSVQERPQLEMERSQLLESIANDQQMLRDLEDKSLSLLHKSQGKTRVVRAQARLLCS